MNTELKKYRVPPEAKIIGSNLRALREAAGFSQNEIGKILHISFQQVQKYESGKNRIPIEKAYVLKHVYNVPYAKLFTGLDHLLAGIKLV
jgi:transcriptional regulator with XRE-family HTH domain